MKNDIPNTDHAAPYEGIARLEEAEALAVFADFAFRDAGALGDRSELQAINPAIISRYFDAIGRLTGQARELLDTGLQSSALKGVSNQ
jgi:hypothetical protein